MSTLCKVCNILDSESRYHGRCRGCALARRRKKEQERYTRLREFFVDQLGGKCDDCGSTNKLEFDHVIAEGKSFHINSRLAAGSFQLLQNEINKCVLLCQNCHIIKSKRDDDYHKYKKVKP
jgi:hypothetical protein